MLPFDPATLSLTAHQAASIGGAFLISGPLLCAMGLGSFVVGMSRHTVEAGRATAWIGAAVVLTGALLTRLAVALLQAPEPPIAAPALLCVLMVLLGIVRAAHVVGAILRRADAASASLWR